MQTVTALDDIDEITNVTSLFLYKYRIMPASEEYENILSNVFNCLCETLNTQIIINLRNHLDSD